VTGLQSFPTPLQIQGRLVDGRQEKSFGQLRPLRQKVLKSIDTCAPKAPNFGVPEQNVFK
jgi:hypothetical protein